MIKMGNAVDFHTHILPGIDDGAPDVEVSVKMLQSLLAQGVDTVVLTPHFYTYKDKLPDFLLKREEALKKLKLRAADLRVNLAVGSETYLTDYIFSNDDISQLCVSCGRFLLTELPFATSFSERTFNRVGKLIDTYDVVPVFAHIERYPMLLKDEGCLSSLIDMGCLAQINLDSLSDGILQRKKLLRYIESNLVQLVGTDCHNLLSRPPQYAQGAERIVKKLGIESLQLLNDNARQIIQGKQ